MARTLGRIVSTFAFGLWVAAMATTPAQAQFADAQESAAAPAPDEASEDATTVAALSADELRVLVAPVALYPDELLAVVLPASTNPLQVVQASRFLEKQKSDATLQPDPNWDPAIIALLNYPQVIKQLNDDLEWTEQLGNAVMDQQEDVLNAIQTARAEAADAGYLQTNDQQVVVNDNDNITIQSAQPDVVYVPTYDPQTVVTNNYVNYPPPVYSDPYPAYYVPGATFFAGAIVGATFAYAFDWDDDDIDIDCCDGRDIDIDSDINIDRGDINIGSGNVDIDRANIQDRFNADHKKIGGDGGMKWSPQKARHKSTAARKPAARPTSANISQSLSKAKPAARVQPGRSVQKHSQRGHGSLAATNKPKQTLNKAALQKKPPKVQRHSQQRTNKALQPKQLKQKKGGAFQEARVPKQKVKAHSNRGQKSLSAGGHSRPRRHAG